MDIENINSILTGAGVFLGLLTLIFAFLAWRVGFKTNKLQKENNLIAEKSLSIQEKMQMEVALDKVDADIRICLEQDSLILKNEGDETAYSLRYDIKTSIRMKYSDSSCKYKLPVAEQELKINLLVGESIVIQEEVIGFMNKVWDKEEKEEQKRRKIQQDIENQKARNLSLTDSISDIMASVVYPSLAQSLGDKPSSFGLLEESQHTLLDEINRRQHPENYYEQYIIEVEIFWVKENNTKRLTTYVIYDDEITEKNIY